MFLEIVNLTVKVMATQCPSKYILIVAIPNHFVWHPVPFLFFNQINNPVTIKMQIQCWDFLGRKWKMCFYT